MEGDYYKTQQYYDEAWVAIYKGRDEVPKASYLVGDFIRQKGYRKSCEGRAGRHLKFFGKEHLLSSEFGFKLSDDEINEKLSCV